MMTKRSLYPWSLFFLFYLQATHDLETADDKRHKEFKEYEMTKEHMKREKLKHMDAAHRKAEEEAEKKAELLHKNHPKLHHPVSTSPDFSLSRLR